MCACLLACAALLCVPLAPPTPAQPPAPPPASLAAPPAAFVEPSGRITLSDALQAVLLGSPRLAALAPEVAAREAEMMQAATRPNPELEAEVENVAGSGELEGFSSAEATLALSRVFELGGKRGKRRALASAERDLAGWDYEVERVAVLAEATRRFVRVVGAQEHAELAGELVQVAESMLEAVSERVAAGASSPVEKSRARVELQTVRIDAEETRRELTVARQQLAALWGSGTPLFDTAVLDLESVVAPPDWDGLRARAEANPGLRRGVTDQERRRATLALEQARGVPDLGVGAGVRWLADSDDAGLVFGLGLPLPLFDRNRGAARAAELRVHSGESEQRAAEVELESALGTAHHALLAAHAEATALRDHVLPEASAAFAQAADAYRQGLLRLTDVLDTERTLFELRGRYVDALARYHESVADVEELLGSSLGGADSGGPGE